jgi:hypothetical protein
MRSLLLLAIAISTPVAPARADPRVSEVPQSTCDAAVRIDGSPEDVTSLRTALAGGALHDLRDPVCDRAVIAIVRRGDDWLVGLQAEGVRVDREVGDLGAAAGWIEGWLTGTPPFATPATAIAAAARPSPPAEPGPAPRREPDRAARPSPSPIVVQPAVHVALTASTAAGNDGSIWGGVQLAPRLQVSPSFWLGGALGGQMDTTWRGPANAPAPTSRLGVHAAMRGGTRIALTSRTALFVGGGVGVVWGVATREFERDDDDISQGGLFGEVLAEAWMPVSSRLSLVAGIGAKGAMLTTRGRQDETERLVPDAMPPLMAGAHVGAGWTFGDAR